MMNCANTNIKRVHHVLYTVTEESFMNLYELFSSFYIYPLQLYSF